MRKVIPLLLILAFLWMPAIAQQVIIEDEPVDPTRVLVFLPDQDVPPPYEVTGEVIDGAATIYINGIQVQPNPQRRKGIPAFPISEFDLCREGFADLQCDMMALGHTHDEVVEAIAERVSDCPGVVSVERNEIQLMVKYEDESEIEYWVTKVNCDLQKTVDWKIRRFQRELDNGYAYLFTKARDINVKPDEYELFVSEIQEARNGNKSAESEWFFLTPELVRSIRRGKEE